MGLMVWGTHFATGIEQIDARHKGLVDLAHAAKPQLGAIGESPACGVRPVLDLQGTTFTMMRPVTGTAGPTKTGLAP